jgi:hypothetical protein
MQERRRQSRLSKNAKGMGVGKKYPGVGTHHRNTKHVWLFSELAEVSAAYKEHHTTMPLWAIADMLYYSFSQQVQYNQQQQQQQQQQQAAENDDQPIYQHQEPRVHIPNIQAIQAKLIDCDSLQHKDMLGYSSVPTQIHKQVWEHLALAEKHRAMLKQQQQDKPIKQEQPVPKSTRKLLRHDFLFGTDAEFEATLPPAKRRKVMLFDDEEEQQQQQQPQIKQEQQQQQQQPATALPTNMSKEKFDAGVAELAGLLEQVDDTRRQERALIQRLVNQIRDHNDQIGSLVSNIKDSHAEIEQHRQAIAHKMQQIESIITPVPLPTPAAAPAAAPAATPATQAMVCNKCTKTISASLGGFSVCYTDPSHPDNGIIECDDCAPISPASRKFLEDTNAEYEAMAAAAQHHLEPEETSYSDDDDMYMNDGYYPGFGGCYYDHAEECS